MTANTAYDVFLALSEKEREKFLLLVDKHKTQIKVEFKKNKKSAKISKEEAIDYLIKNIFSSKK